MRNGLAYLVAALCLGWVAVWGSELMFWISPPPDTNLIGIALAWILYSLCAGAALSACIWTGLGGWRAAFLGGALLGIFVEGAAVSTMYDAFPVQLVWTPLAWHALITGLGVLGGAFALIRGGILRQIGGVVALGVFGAAWGLYWPTERSDPADLPLMLIYLGLTGVGAVAALVCLSRLPPVRLGWWHWIAPAGVLSLWVLGTVLAPSPVRLAGPAMVAATLWAMRRLGGRRQGAGGRGPDFGPPLRWGRSLLCVIAPIVTSVLAVAGWKSLGAQPTNIPIALGTGTLGLGLWLWLLARAAMRR